MSDKKSTTSSSDMDYNLLTSVFAIWSSVRIHGEDNIAVKQNLDNFRKIAEPFIKKSGELTFECRRNIIFINNKPVEATQERINYLNRIATFFISVHIGVINFPEMIEWDDIVTFCAITNKFPYGTVGNEETYERLNSLILENKLSLTISPYKEPKGNLTNLIEKSQLARQLYSNMVRDFEIIQNKALLKKQMPVKTAIRNIQILIDLMNDSEPDSQFNTLLTMTSINNFNGKYIATHSTNITILSIALAVTLKLSLKEQKTLGIAAYLHDIGITDEHVTASDEKAEQNHVEYGFRMMINSNELNHEMMEAASITANHHRSHDFRGNLVLPAVTTDNPYEEIVKVADYYDIVTKVQPGSDRHADSRIKAVKNILDFSISEHFSPEVAKALFTAMGILPPGILLKDKSDSSIYMSLGGFTNKNSSSEAIMLDNRYRLRGRKKVSLIELSELHPESIMNISPETYTEIFNSF